MPRRTPKGPDVVHAIAVRATTAIDTARMVESAKTYAAAAKSENTRRGYQSDWRAYERWCARHGHPSLPTPPAALALYVTSLADAGRKASTIDRALAAISQAHHTAGHDSPRRAAVVRAVVQGVKRIKGTAPTQKAPITPADLRRMLDTPRPGRCAAFPGAGDPSRDPPLRRLR